jgi:hypothetical protein
VALHLRRPQAFLGPEFSRTTLLYLHYANAVKVIAIDYGHFYMCRFGHLVSELKITILRLGLLLKHLNCFSSGISADLTAVYDLFEDNKQTTPPILRAVK